MVLTEKDKEFLETLKRLMESRELWVDLRTARPSYMVLRGTYGDKLHKTFRVSRQGVRWRFQRLFNRIYVDAFETILFIETTFGTGLRDHAIRISRERHTLRQELTKLGFRSASSMSRADPGSEQGGDHE